MLCSEVLVWRQDIAVNGRASSGKIGLIFYLSSKTTFVVGVAPSIWRNKKEKWKWKKDLHS